MKYPPIGTIVRENCGGCFYYGIVKAIDENLPFPIKVQWLNPKFVEHIGWPHKFIEIVGHEHTPHLSALLLRY